MAQAEEEMEEQPPARPPRRAPRLLRWVAYSALGLMLLTTVVAWFSRERILDDALADQLAQLDIPATYEIVSVGADRQVLRNLVVGSPQRPDLTIEEVTVALRYRFGAPEIDSITLVQPRLYGTLIDGRMSFGALDPLLFERGGQSQGLPDIAVIVEDGRSVLHTQFGAVAAKLDGKGNMRSGFDGVLAVNAPQIALQGCAMEAATAYGRIATDQGKVTFSGPLRLRDTVCDAQALRATGLAMQSQIHLSDDFSRIEMTANLEMGRLTAGAASLAAVTGAVRTSLGGEKNVARYSLTGNGFDTSWAKAGQLTLTGTARANADFSSIALQTAFAGDDVRADNGLLAQIGALADHAKGTFAAPLLAKAKRALTRELAAARFAGDLDARLTGGLLSVAVPQARLQGASGATLLSVSRLRLLDRGPGSGPGFGPGQGQGQRQGQDQGQGQGQRVFRLDGNFATGGRDLPQIVGRMEQLPGRDAYLRLLMSAYRAEGSSLEVPQLVVSQGRNGAIGFNGRVLANGPLPGGGAKGLDLPISGNWTSQGGFALWRQCAPVRFAALRISNLEFDRQQLTVCPAKNAPILQMGDSGFRMAGGLTELALDGRLAGTPISLATGAVGFAYPGVFNARNIDVTLGPGGTTSRFRLANISGSLDTDLGGEFDGVNVFLDAVPLDIYEARGRWAYRDGELRLDQAALRVEDRQEADRFAPLTARDAQLVLENNLITSQAVLRAPESDREVTSVSIRHDLGREAGRADIAVDGLRFDAGLQPDTLTELARGVIANVEGVVTGSGEITWDAQSVASEGRFSSESIDLAAAFGPVSGLSGTVAFDDLLALTTAPGQRLSIGAVNPGIEVYDGEITFSLVDGQLLSLHEGRWPFLGGTLELKPVRLNFAAPEERAYEFVIEGLDAGQFIQQLELGNLNAAGTFDGTLPIVFDAMGNGRIDGGYIQSRAPGGNLSYVGELTYEDLSPIANFAFDALRSLDYRSMRVVMDGALTGEIVTRVTFDGISQGEGADSNIVTRQIAKLPLQFRVNISAPFYQLMTSLRSMYDPAFVRDPSDVGLSLPANVGRQRDESLTQPSSGPTPGELPIQNPESEPMP